VDLKMNYFYLPDRIKSQEVAIEDADQLHHLRDVLRLSSGERVTVFDSAGREFLCSIVSIAKQQVSLKVIDCLPDRPAKFKLALACAVPKKSGMDDIVDKLTQVGADTIIPLLTERVIARNEDIQGARLERWRKIARSAAEQSRRNTLPVIPGLMRFDDLIAGSAGYDLKLIPTLDGRRRTLPQIIMQTHPAAVLVLIGPEGDFTEKEVGHAVDAGFQPVTLGKNVLKVETAAVSVAAYLRLALS
jgi:16S rRNA (uracil1498-N3)-methyltransferase